MLVRLDQVLFALISIIMLLSHDYQGQTSTLA